MKILVSVLLACSSLAAFLLPGCSENAQIPAAEAESGNRGPIRVGSVEMEMLFHSYAKTGDFHEKVEKIQLRFEELGEEDFEQMMQLQGEFQLAQMEFFQGFKDDVEETARKIGAELHLDIVAVDVLFSSENAEIIDVTENFMETELFGMGNFMGHTHSEFCGPECE